MIILQTLNTFNPKPTQEKAKSSNICRSDCQNHFICFHIILAIIYSKRRNDTQLKRSNGASPAGGDVQQAGPRLHGNTVYYTGANHFSLFFTWKKMDKNEINLSTNIRHFTSEEQTRRCQIWQKDASWFLALKSLRSWNVRLRRHSVCAWRHVRRTWTYRKTRLISEAPPPSIQIHQNGKI